MKHYDAAIILTVTANVLSLAAAIWLALGPAYQGASVTAVAIGGVAGEPVRTTATFVEANGLRVLPLIFTPVILTALAALAATVLRADSVWRGPLILALAVVLLGLCVVALFSIGLLFLPAALFLLFAGGFGLRRKRI
jgi:hypothetical protein